MQCVAHFMMLYAKKEAIDESCSCAEMTTSGSVSYVVTAEHGSGGADPNSCQGAQLLGPYK